MPMYCWKRLNLNGKIVKAKWKLIDWIPSLLHHEFFWQLFSVYLPLVAWDTVPTIVSFITVLDVHIFETPNKIHPTYPIPKTEKYQPVANTTQCKSIHMLKLWISNCIFRRKNLFPNNIWLVTKRRRYKKSKCFFFFFLHFSQYLPHYLYSTQSTELCTKRDGKFFLSTLSVLRFLSEKCEVLILYIGQGEMVIPLSMRKEKLKMLTIKDMHI